MKRRIGLILSVLMLFTACTPVHTSAAGDAGLENAIKSVKEFFVIPEDLVNFNYSKNTNGNRDMWMLHWNSKDDMGGSISASVDNKGEILDYNQYKYVDESNIKKLPKFSNQEARIIAEEIIQKINPGIFKDLKAEEDAAQSIMDQIYYFNYIRTNNGIPFPSNTIRVSINRQTGELQNYRKVWNEDAVFPSENSTISIKEAREAYIKNLGLRLTYNVAMDNDNIRIYPAYTPAFNTNYYLDAYTGERIFLGNYYYGDYESGGLAFDEKADSANGRNTVVLSPEEIKAVEDVANLITQEDAEKIARGTNILEMDDSYKVTNAGLNRNYPSKTDFAWNLYFVSDAKGEKMDYKAVNVSLNARTGEIINFSINYPGNNDEKPKYDKEASKEIVQKFLTEIMPVKINEVEYDDTNNNDYLKGSETEVPRVFNFRYVRKVKDIYFPDNGVTVRFDAVTGKITSYNLDWYNDVEFPSIENSISLDKVYENFFNDIGLRLQYYSQESDRVLYMKTEMESEKEEGIKLVYAVNTGKPLRLDPYTGNILDYDGELYKEKKIAEYSDISGHYAEEVIKVLAESGISLEGPQFKPDEDIIQKDFLLLISQITNNGYQFMGKTALRNDTETEDLYNLLIREGIVKQEEKNPDALLTREESVKFIIRVLKYDKVADLGHIFNCSFLDKSDIDPELIGYVVVANGLKIVNGYGDYFRPKNRLSRADAIILIYNYLQM